MKHYAYYLDSGEIVALASLPDDVSPDGLNGPHVIETQGLIDQDAYKVVDGLLVPYESAGLERKRLNRGAGYSWNTDTQDWVDNRPLTQLKAAKWAEIKAARDATEFGGFTWDGCTFDSDAMSQQRIQGAAQLAALNSSMSIDWTLADDSVRTLSAAEMIFVGIAMGQHINAQHGRARLRRQAIHNATTAQEVAAVSW